MNRNAQQGVVVVGGGIVGLCTAYYLAKAGHQVAVLERRGNVAEEASFGQPGLVAPACIGAHIAPNLPKTFLASLFHKEQSVILEPTLDRSLWRWLDSWRDEAADERGIGHAGKLARLAQYSQRMLEEIEETYQPEYEQTNGAMRLYRTAAELETAQATHDVLAEAGIATQLIDADAVRSLEPGIGADTPLAGALYSPEDLSGNCSLFARHLKQINQSLGVQFHFSSNVDSLTPDVRGIAIRVGEQLFVVDAVVVAAGCGSADLLAPLGLQLPLRGVKGYAATATIKNFDAAPHGSVVDAASQVSITRIGNRIRLAGVVEPCSTTTEIHEKAMRTLIRIASDWFPDAANYNTALFWAGMRPLLPEGLPLLGATRIPNLYVNVGHGAAGWSLAAGSGRIVADIVSGEAPEIDIDALTSTRYG